MGRPTPKGGSGMTTDLPTDAIHDAIEPLDKTLSPAKEALAQLQALLDDNTDLSRTLRALEAVSKEKDARIVKLEKENNELAKCVADATFGGWYS